MTAVNDGARRHGAILLAAGALLFFWRLGDHDLWPPDEPRFALVAREMFEQRDYSVLSLNDRLYTDKPPLFFWAINGFARLLGGVDERAVRLPSAVAALGALFLIHALGTRLYDRRTGLLGALVFATAAQIAERARWGSIDMTLNLFVLGAIVLLERARGEDPPGAGRGAPAARLAGPAAWGLMGLATLAKGPVGLVLPLLAVLPIVLIERDGRGARRLFPTAGVALYLAVTLAWFARFAHRLGWDQALFVLWHQNVERYVDAWNAQHPPWFYLWRFPLGFLPWTLILPWALAHAFGKEERARRPAALFLVTWMAAILLFFSFSTGKRGVYIIPLYPAAALLVGRFLSAAPVRRLRAPLALWIGGALLLLVALPIAAFRRDPDLVGTVAAIPALLLIGGLLALAVIGRVRPGGALVAPAAAAAPAPAAASPAAPASVVPTSVVPGGCLVGAAALMVLVAVGALYPRINEAQNIRGFAETIRPLLRADVPFACVEEKRETWVFYTGRFAEPVDTPAESLAFLRGAPPRDLLIDARTLEVVRPELPPDVTEIARGRAGRTDWRLLRRAESP